VEKVEVVLIKESAPAAAAAPNAAPGPAAAPAPLGVDASAAAAAAAAAAAGPPSAAAHGASPGVIAGAIAGAVAGTGAPLGALLARPRPCGRVPEREASPAAAALSGLVACCEFFLCDRVCSALPACTAGWVQCSWW